MAGRISDEAGRLAAEGLKKAGINFVSILPDIQHTSIQEALQADPKQFMIHHMSEEGLGYATCCGAWLGGGKPVLICTTAGLFNMCWAISAFKNFDFPLVMLIPHRGVLGETIWFMRKYIHRIEPFLQLFEVPFEVVNRNEEIIPTIIKASETSFNLYVVSTILFSGGTLSGGTII
jgi:sulfopyruvate decarboxylase TPP-binding subunit